MTKNRRNTTSRLIFFGLALLAFLSSCHQKPSPSETAEKVEDTAALDTTISKLKETENRTQTEAIPSWVLEMYPDSLLEKKRILNQDIWKFEPLNDSVNLVYLRRSDLTCSWTHLQVLLHRRPINSVELEEICDQDLGYFEYEVSSFRPLDSLQFELLSYRYTVPDSFLDGNWIKDKQDFYALAQVDSLRERIKILASGRIITID